eukprot:TRINITY_DN6776_c0_g4_i1.p1 TRINITY_DN6776_c0_g4~~TRINITY_DN6776_c0_g4_i1.p1  ORF type:complete len:360 (+),score=66.28 TRINITY_DN6776_c0_g4_i1:134-1081(+)
MIQDFVSCEHAYINLDNPSFIGGHKALRQTMEQRRRERDDSQTNNNADSDGNSNQGNNKGNKATNGQNGKTQDGVNPLSKVGLQVIQEDGNNEDNTMDSDSVPAGGGGWFSFLRSDQRQGSSQSSQIVENGIMNDQQFMALLPSPKPKQHNDQILVDVTRKLVGSYFDVVRKNMQDMVPKAIMHFLVLHCKKGLQNHLIQTLYKDELIDSLMQEREDIAAKRQNAKAALVALEQATKELETIPNELTKRVHLDGSQEMMVDGMSDYSNYGGYRTPRIGGAKDKSAAARMAMQAAAQAQGISPAEEVFGFDSVEEE